MIDPVEAGFHAPFENASTDPSFTMISSSFGC
jgi:hypothetical protein